MSDPMAPTFELLARGKAIRCRLCGSVSYNPGDVVHRYCARCHIFHDTDGARLVQAALGAWCLCESLLASPGATPELITECRDALGQALRPFTPRPKEQR